jgi:hypothetical protein
MRVQPRNERVGRVPNRRPTGSGSSGGQLGEGATTWSGGNSAESDLTTNRESPPATRPNARDQSRPGAGYACVSQGFIATAGRPSDFRIPLLSASRRCLIATFCLTSGHALLHCDSDFDPFEKHLGLKVVHPPGVD